MSRTIASSTTNSVEVPITKIGPPGIVASLTVEPVFKDKSLNEKRQLEKNFQRKFLVSARFSKGIEIESSINFSFAESSGDSLLSIPGKASFLEVEVSDGASFSIYPNNERRFSTVRYECIANSPEEARKLFHSTVGPVLDRLVYVANTPLHIVQISIFDEVQKTTSTDIFCPYPVVALHSGIGRVNERMAPVYAMYREAISTASPFYKFFCFYKILEGLLRKLKSSLYEEARLIGVDLPSMQVKVPDYVNISQDQKPYVGKSVTRFFDEFLTNRFRNSMAHFITDEGAALNVNEVEEMRRYSAVIEVSELCCRSVISHFEMCIEVLTQKSK